MKIMIIIIIIILFSLHHIYFSLKKIAQHKLGSFIKTKNKYINNKLQKKIKKNKNKHIYNKRMNSKYTFKKK
jgi:uncharacterized ion transporter superfamily protein YfcC